jgi:hypothetical protein
VNSDHQRILALATLDQATPTHPQIGRADDTKKIAAHRRRAAQEDCRGQPADVDTSMCQSLTKGIGYTCEKD